MLLLAYVSDLWPRALVSLQVSKDALGILEDGADLVPYLPLSFGGLGIFKIQEKMRVVFNFPGKDFEQVSHPSKPGDLPCDSDSPIQADGTKQVSSRLVKTRLASPTGLWPPRTLWFLRPW